MTPRIAIVHDHVVQRGGAERVLLAMARAFPDAPVYTSVYAPELTYPEFREVDLRPAWINRVGPLRRHHRCAMPILAPLFERLRVDAEVVICSSAGWAHGVRAPGVKLVYCYAPPRWLYQTDRYLGGGSVVARATLAALGGYLRRWDRRSAATAHRYLTLSSAVRDQLRRIYGIEAEIIPPPHGVRRAAPQRPPGGIAPGYLLCVSRLLPYKNVDRVLAAAALLPGERLVVVGGGPQARALASRAPANCTMAGVVDDDQLRWLYANCDAVVSASHEDFGLTPVEGAAFGKPCVVLRGGGFLDTVTEGRTGVFFERPTAEGIAAAVRRMRAVRFDAEALRRHADGYSEAAFARSLRAAVTRLAGGQAPAAASA